MAAYSALLSRAGNVSNTPFTPYTGQETAPVNEQQLMGVGSTNMAAMGFAPYAGQAGSYISAAGTPVSPSDISQYMDPYTSSVINATQADFDTQNARAKSVTDSGAAAQGALGGNRVGVAEALTQEGQERVQAPVIAGLQSQGFQSAVTNANAQKQRELQAGSTLAGSSLAAAGQQFGVGTAEQQTQQAADTQQMTDYYTAQGYPFATAQWLAGITLGTGAQMGQSSSGQSTTEGPQPNTIAQGVGAGLTALSMFSDKRLKENIKEVGRLHDGQKIYRYNFKGDPTTHVGLISQEVEKKHPHAVSKVAGFGAVDYDKATEDAIKKWSGGAISGFADGGTPYGPGTQGWVPTIGKIGGATLHDPGVQAPKMGEQKQPDYSGMGKSLGTIGKGLSDWYNDPMTQSAPAEWGGFDSSQNEGFGASADIGGLGFERGGAVRKGFEDGGVPTLDDRFSAMDDMATPVSLGFTGALEPSYEKRFGAGVPIKLPESKGFEPVQGDPTGVEDKVPVPTPRPDIAGPPGQGVKSGVGPAAYPTEGGISAPDTTSRRAGDIKQVIANEWSRAGMSPQGITGIYMNIADESRFDPTSRHWDQPNPKFRGTEAENAHGLYQEGGDEWNKYQSWLQKNAPGSDWRDPALQSRFTAENLKANYPQVWDRMQNAKTPGEAAAAFVAGYLKPAREHLAARTNKYLSGEGENPDVMQASYRSGFAPESTGVPRGQPPFIPGVSAPPEQKARTGMGGFNPLGLSDEARQGLISMGLGMMANRRGGKGSFLASVGEGGEQGMTTYASARAATQAQEGLQRKEALEREKMMLPYSNMTMNERMNAAYHAADLQEKQRAHDLAVKTPVKYGMTKAGVDLYAIPRPNKDGTVDFWPIDPATGQIASSPLGGSLKDGAARALGSPSQSVPPVEGFGGQQPSGGGLQQASLKDGIILANNKLVQSGPFDYSETGPIIEKGMEVPEPQETAGKSAQSLKTDAEYFLQTGKLPPVRGGRSPVAIAQQQYSNAVKNYGNSLAASRGMTAAEMAEGWRTAPGMLRFVLGADGRTTVALGTAVRHLDTVQELAKAWEANDTQAINRIRAVISRQFGDSAATNLDVAGKIIGPEIIKAIGVAGAGTAEERQAAAQAFSTASSPKQLLDAVRVTQKLLGGQLEGRQRQAANAGVSEERFKSLIGDRPYEILKGIDKGASGKSETTKMAPADRFKQLTSGGMSKAEAYKKMHEEGY